MSSPDAEDTVFMGWRGVLVVTLGPALLAAIVFAGTLQNDLLYDDPAALALASAPASRLVAHRFGLTYLTIRQELLAWGSWSPGFHLTNVLLHALCSSLAAWCALDLTGRVPAALLCGILFAVHPVHVEAVASIENRKELLAMLFVASGLLLYRSRRRPTWSHAAALACFVLGLQAKEVAAVGLVGTLPLADLLPRPERDIDRSARLRRAARRVLPMLLLAIVATGWYAGDILAKFSSASIEWATEGACHDYREVLATSAGSVPEVARLLFFPARLSVDYPARAVVSLADRRALAGALLLAGWVAATAVFGRWIPVAAFAMAWTLVMYLPLSNLVPLTPFFVAERYLYVPSLGPCLLVALALDGLAGMRIPGGRAAAVGLAGVLIASGGARSIARTLDWRDGLTLWSSALRAVPEGSERIERELGRALRREGRVAEAIPHLQRAVEFAPAHAELHDDLGLALLQSGRAADAIAEFRRALDLWPANPLVRYNLATALVRVGEVDEATPLLRGLATESAWSDLPAAVGAALAERGMTAEQLRAAIRRWLEATAKHRGAGR